MKKFLFAVMGMALLVMPVRGQDAVQQQIDKLSGQIQDLLDAQALINKRLDALEQSVSDLQDKVNSPQVSDCASQEDLKQLAEQVKEIDKKRQADRDLILKELKKLGTVSAVPSHKSTHVKANTDDNASSGSQKGYYYPVHSGDTIAAIAKAYRDQGVKVTTGDILKANPKINPKKLAVGQKVFIPDPNAK